MVGNILRGIGGLLTGPGAMERDPTEAFRLYAPPNLLDAFTPEQQALYGRQIQEQQRFINANLRPSFSDVQSQITQAAQTGAGLQQQQQTQGQLANIFGGAPMPGQPAPAAGGRPMPSAPPQIAQIINEAATRHGVDPAALTMIAQMESGFDPSAQNPNSSASGLFQFINSTAQQYGLQNPLDPAQSADAAARKMKDNAAALTLALGREPTAAELYLAHQQGATGASRLLSNPDQRAVDVVGRDQVLLNGGDENMTAGEFANMWMSRTQGGQQPGQPAAPAQGGYDRRASAQQYHQAARLFASQGNVDAAKKYHEIAMGLDPMSGPDGNGSLRLGADIDPNLDPNMLYFVDEKGKPTPVGTDATANAPAVNTILNTFAGNSRENRDRLTAADTAVKALGSTNDFAITQGLLTWLQAIGANPRTGADGNYVAESGVGAEFVRILNQIRGGERLRPEQRADLVEQITQARDIVMNRQEGLNEVLAAQLEQLNVPPAVKDQMIRSITGAVPAATTTAAAAPAAPAAAPVPPAAAATGAPITITTDEEYDALPSGTVFVDPNGVTRRKP